ncbi:hypothetical protein PS627_04361 [Pseudomonas fluorescens]|nr:hypothetical protein PS627_04361 [Pseudomonas fluorescens]
MSKTYERLNGRAKVLQWTTVTELYNWTLIEYAQLPTSREAS